MVQWSLIAMHVIGNDGSTVCQYLNTGLYPTVPEGGFCFCCFVRPRCVPPESDVAG